MRTKILVDAIVRQTTVLIAQLTVHEGVRSPLANLVDDVFLSLSKELEAQGVSRPVAADMFGLALRSYQRRMSRLQQAQGTGRTLWQTVFEYIQENSPVTRNKISRRFRNDDAETLAAVLSDLFRTGLVSRTGSGPSAVYSVASEEVQLLLAREEKEEIASAMVWLDLTRNPGSAPSDVAKRLGVDVDTVSIAIENLRAEGQITSAPGEPLEVSAISISLDAEQGFEAAVFDQFQAMATAVGAKLQLRSRGVTDPTIGGGTFAYEVSDDHPLKEEVLGFLERTREEARSLWDRVEAQNAVSPISEDEIWRVVFYFGQSVKGRDDE